MTNLKLKKEAEEWTKDHSGLIGSYKFVKYDYDSMQKAYLAGAEPREKRIAVLEAEVKEWKDKADLWCKTANLRNHNIMINKELEKENAELKERLKEHESVGNAQFWENVWSWKTKAEQLTKAKEIIKTLLSRKTDFDEKGFALWAWKEEVNKAEQFLRDNA